MRENTKSVVLFVCEHGSAKSVVAAHFNRLARERNLNVRALSRGTDPDEDIPPNVMQGLESEGLAPDEPKPRLLSKAEVAGAICIVKFCDFPKDFEGKKPLADWSDVPPVSENYDKARDEIAARVKILLNEI